LEQARGLPLDSRTDLFSLGAVLYEVLAGRPAFDGDTFSDILASVLTHDPLPLKALGPQYPPARARIVDRALQKDLTQRYQSAEEMVPASRRSGRQASQLRDRPQVCQEMDWIARQPQALPPRRSAVRRRRRRHVSGTLRAFPVPDSRRFVRVRQCVGNARASCACPRSRPLPA